jgi:hypothetical protein
MAYKAGRAQYRPDGDRSMPAARFAPHQNTRRSPDSVAEPLGVTHQFYIADAIAGAAPDWCVEFYSDMPGTGTIIIMPDDADDDIGPTYFVHREGHMLCLDQLHWDSYSSVGRFADIGAVAQELRGRLLSHASTTMPVSRMLH